MKPDDMTLCMEKKGLLVPQGNHHAQCVVQDTTAYEYYVRIEIPAGQLPADGWIVEVNELHKRLQRTYAQSCEKMAMSLCQTVEEILKERKVHPIKVIVRLTGAAGGEMTAIWERPNLSDNDIKTLAREVAEYAFPRT